MSNENTIVELYRKDGALVGVLCVGYTDERRLSIPLTGFLRRAALVIVTTLERIATYHDLTVALNLAAFKGDVVEFMFKHGDYEEIRNYIGAKVCEITGAQHLMLCSDDGSRADWFGKDAPPCCHDCAKAAVNFGKHLPNDFFTKGETVIVPEGSTLPNMNLPSYCPMRSSVISQFRQGDGWWRMVADYTRPHSHDLAQVARGLRLALELLAISHDRQRREETIARMQEHQSFRADALAYALSKDDLPGLVDLTLHRLLDLSDCDYIAIHTVDGDHRLLFPGDELKTCPERCEACPFYKLILPPGETADHVIELNDTRVPSASPIPSDCPAHALAVVVIHCDGKPWGGIALHYLNRQEVISRDDRVTLEIAANVLTMALERHSAAVRLKAERDRVVEAEKARSDFFSSVSHDIRTPLNVIVGFSEILQTGGLSPEESRQHLESIVSSGKTLLQLVNDILDLSKMDLGKLEFNFEPTDIGKLVRELVQVFQPTAQEKGQTIVTDIPDLPRLKPDPYRLRQVLFNFLGNAVKYAGPCTIRVSVAYEGGLLKLTVADNGRGVSPEKAKLLMQPFIQADIKNRSEGSGLGLAICKRLVEIAHGTIVIETSPGKGFSIHTEVPVDVAPEEANQAADAPSEAMAAVSNVPRRVLIVDDFSANRTVMTVMLRKMGVADIEQAEDGRDALRKLEKDPAFDLVLTDLWMPVMDGAELVKGIRADARLASLKVCALTADVEVRTTFREQGFDMLLLKPVTVAKIAEVFRGLA